MSEYVDFHYMPLEGKITGEQVLKQTEDAINDLGNKVYSLDIDQSEIDEAIEKSNEAINTANSALSAVTTGRSVWFNNVAEMVATDIEAGVTAETKGYYVANDGGNALYLIRQEKSGDVVDGGSLIALDNGNMAELVTDGTVNVKQFGAIGNGTDDDTTVFQNTSSYAQANGFVPFVGVATYKITGSVTGTFNSFGEVTITGGGTVDIINLHEVVSDVSDIRDEVVDETASAKAYSESAAASATNASNSASSASTTATQLMAYLADKETLTAPAVDTTLTISGAAADAKVTGDLIGDINHAIATGEEVTRFDFNWTSGAISASGISASNDYFYSNPMSASEGLKYKFNTGNYVIEVWAFDESSPNTFYRRSNIPANSVDWQPSAGWLGGHEKARFLYYYQDNPSLISAIKTEKQLALYSELSQTNSSMSILANYGGIPNYIDFDWEIGDIDAQGEIQPSQTGYYHSKLLSRTEFENAVYTLTSTAFVYRYNSDGTFLNRGTSIAAGTTIIPSDALGTVATQARIVVLANYYADTQGFYINKTLYTEKEAGFKIVSVEDPYYFVPAIIPTQVSYKFTSITYEYNGNTYTKPFADIATDIIYGHKSYDDGKVSDAYYIIKGAGERIQIAIDPVLNKFIVVRNDITTKYTIICVNLTTGAVSGAIADAYRHIVFDTMMKTQKKIPYDVIQQLDTKEKTLYGLYDDSSFIFAYLSDCHVWGFEKGVETNLTGLAANRYDEHISFDTILNCGDSVLSVDAYPDSNPYVALENSAFKTNRAKTLYVEGNHDRNIISPVMPIKNFVNLMYREIKRDTNVHFGKPDNGAYYYKDFPQHKIRLIVLTLYDIDIDAYNSNEGYKQDQMEWFANTALVVDSDWHVIVACHTTPIQIHDNNPSQNDNVCKGILESFVAGTSVTINSTSVNVNYPSYSVTTHFTQAGNLVGFFSGHVHKDAFATVNGVNYVSINCGYIEAAQISVRQGFTYSAICFDVAIVDKTNRTVTLKRIGYGSDRNWSY